MSDSSPMLEARKLHRRYRMGVEDLHVLDGASLAARRGEWVAIIGSSGSGKSTLLHLMGGLDRPDAGTVRFEGRDIFGGRAADLDAYRRRTVGFVFQFYHLLPELTAIENVLVGAMIGRSLLGWPGASRDVRRRADALMERLGLAGRRDHRPAKLSGGERQRVAIARALINEPPVLLADEPTGNLDAATGRDLLDVFTHLHAEGQTIVMVTHDARVAEAAERQVILEDGKVA